MTTRGDDPHRVHIEDLALALVREYLAKRKYKTTLTTLQSELPFTPVKTTTTALARDLGISKFVARNSKSEKPYATLLEIFADYMYGKYGKEAAVAAGEGGAAAAAATPKSSSKSSSASASTSTPSTSSSSSSSSKRRDTADEELARKLKRATLTRTNNLMGGGDDDEGSSYGSKARSRQQRDHSPEAPVADAISSPIGAARGTFSGSNSFRTSSLSASRSSQLVDEDEVDPPIDLRGKKAPRMDADLMLEEDVDFDSEMNSFASHSRSTSGAGGFSGAAQNHAAFPTKALPPATPVSLEEAHRAKSLIFGSMHLTGTFTDPWLTQGFPFKTKDVTNKVPSLGFGLVQHQGGPCGMLAVVQAFVLRELLFQGEGAKMRPEQRYALLSPSFDQLKRALIDAWTDILWRVGDQRVVRAVARNPAAGRSSSSGGGGRKMADGSLFKPDGVTESLQLYELRSRSEVANFFTVHHASLSEPRGHGVVLFLYSIIFTRGLANIEKDRDEASSLIGAHSYCTQEMVNLALTGRARSNVFNGTKDFDGSPIGFLSLFEHYDNLEVGSHLKCPEVPIWVICSESHYTVAFGLDEALVDRPPSNGKFDLFYYDELANQKEEIRLSIDVSDPSPAPKDPNGLEPPINECIRTKWGKHARVDWNGVEPIL